MRREHLLVQLPDKCEEDWDKMTPMEQGRLCDTCDKCVVDFAPMTDTEIFRYFKERRSQSICGQFSPDQLDREIRPSLERKSAFSRYKLAASVFLGGLALIPKEGNAQKQETFQLEGVISAIGSRQVNISGVVTDEKGNPINGIGVKFDCKDTVITDSSGRYAYDYVGAKTSLSLAVLDSTGEAHHEQLSLSHLATEHCSNLLKNVKVVQTDTVRPQCHYDERIIRHGGVAVFDIRAPRWIDNVRDTLLGIADSLAKVTPTTPELNNGNKTSESIRTRLMNRLVPRYKEPELEIGGYRKQGEVPELPKDAIGKKGK